MGLGKKSFCLKRDWIRGLIYSYAGPEAKTLLGTPSDLDRCSINIHHHNMHTQKRERLYRNIYRVFAVVLACSALLMFFINVAPFGVGVFFKGGDMIVSITRALSEPGALVMKDGAISGQAELLTVADVLRQDGELYYSVAELSNPIRAREASREVVLQVPIIGYLVHALSHPVGVLALIGIPLFTFALDAVAVAWAGSARATLAQRVVHMRRKREARRARKEEERRRAYALLEEESEDIAEVTPEETPTPKVEPVNGPVMHGMTIRLTRPNRYGMNMR